MKNYLDLLKGSILSAFFIIITLLILSLLFGCTSRYDFDTARGLLSVQGFTDIKNTGYSPFCCSNDDSFSTGFTAKDKFGNVVSGCICSGIGKGITIRFN